MLRKKPWLKTQMSSDPLIAKQQGLIVESIDAIDPCFAIPFKKGERGGRHVASIWDYSERRSA